MGTWAPTVAIGEYDQTAVLELVEAQIKKVVALSVTSLNLRCLVFLFNKSILNMY